MAKSSAQLPVVRSVRSQTRDFIAVKTNSVDWGYEWCSGTVGEILGSFSDAPTGICLNSKPQAKGCACHFIRRESEDVAVCLTQFQTVMHLMFSG